MEYYVMNINVVCPHCLNVSSVEKRESYTDERCVACKASLLECMPLKANAQILEHFIGSSELPVIVDFWAPWCAPCLQMVEHFDKAAMAMPIEAQFLKVNNDSEQALSKKLHIARIPCVLVFKEGKEVDRFMGARSSKKIEQWVRQFI